MGDTEEDPFYRAMRMNHPLLNTLLGGDPFGDMVTRRHMASHVFPATDPNQSRGREVARYGQNGFGMGMGMGLMPMGFPNMGFRNIFSDMNNGNCHSFSSSTVMTMTSGPDGRPQVYQASQTVKQGPGGVRETKKTVADSRTGVKKMAIGHHINDRGHIIEREQNVFSGDQEERQDFINLDEDQAEQFNQEWVSKTRNFNRRSNAAIEYKNNVRRQRPPPPRMIMSDEVDHPQYQPRNNKRPSSGEPSTSHLVSSDDDDEEGIIVKKRKADLGEMFITTKEATQPKGFEIQSSENSSSDESENLSSDSSKNPSPSKSNTKVIFY